MSDQKETEFVDGLIVKAPRAGAPDYIIGSLSIKRQELIAWLEARDGDWVNIEIKRAKSGKYYAAVDNWKPSSERAAAPPPRDYKPQGGLARSAPPPSDTAPNDEIPF